MKTLLLLRHAKSDMGGPDLLDIDRPLNQRGHKSAALIGLDRPESPPGDRHLHLGSRSGLTGKLNPGGYWYYSPRDRNSI